MKFFKPLFVFIILNSSYQHLCAQLLDEASFKKILNNQFVNIITGQNRNTIGNFGALDIKDASATLNASKVTDKGNVLSLNANAAVSDGFSSIFNNSKLNSDVSLQLRYSLIRPQSRAVTYIQSSIQKRDDEVLRLQNCATAEKLLLLSRKNMIEKQVSLFKDEKTHLQALLATNTGDAGLLYQVANKQYQLDSLNLLLENNLKDLAKENEKIDSRTKEAIKKAKQEIPEITGFRFGWINFVYKVTSQSFRLFDPSLASDKQVSKHSYASHKAGIEYNYYKWSLHPGESWFFSAGATVDIANNLSSLSKLELSETRNYSSTPVERTSTKKYNVYAGDYRKNLSGSNLYMDYYKFIFENNNAAIHAYPQVRFQKYHQPVYSFGAGFMVAFKDQKDEKNKTIFNAELYANFIDLTNNAGSDKKLLERNDIGIRFSFPIKFVY